MNDSFIKPAKPLDVQSQQSNGPDIAKVEMLKRSKGWNIQSFNLY